MLRTQLPKLHWDADCTTFGDQGCAFPPLLRDSSSAVLQLVGSIAFHRYHGAWSMEHGASIHLWVSQARPLTTHQGLTELSPLMLLIGIEDASHWTLSCG